MVIQDIEDFMVFEVEESGEKKRIKDISQQNLQSLLHSKQVLVIVRRDLKRIFIWKGSASPVQKRYISSRVAATIRQELSVGLKIVSVDQGDEPKEFLDAFDVYQLVPEGPMNEPNTFNWIERKITSSIMRISSKGINPTTLYWNGEKDTFTCSDNIKLHSEKNRF